MFVTNSVYVCICLHLVYNRGVRKEVWRLYQRLSSWCDIFTLQQTSLCTQVLVFTAAMPIIDKDIFTRQVVPSIIQLSHQITPCVTIYVQYFDHKVPTDIIVDTISLNICGQFTVSNPSICEKRGSQKGSRVSGRFL